MKDQLINKETARIAKEKGFYINTDGKFIRGKSGARYSIKYYGDEQVKELYFQDSNLLIICTQTLLQKYLRETHKINVEITDWSGSGFFKFEVYDLKNWNRINLIPIEWSGKNDYHKENGTSSVFTYEEALEVGLQKSFLQLL